jgi:hypothetical protein
MSVTAPAKFGRCTVAGEMPFARSASSMASALAIPAAERGGVPWEAVTGEPPAGELEWVPTDPTPAVAEMLAMSPSDPRTTQTTTATTSSGREDHPTIRALEKEGKISFPEEADTVGRHGKTEACDPRSRSQRPWSAENATAVPPFGK